MSSLRYVAQHHPTGSETTPYAARISRFGSELPSVEDDVDVWRYAILELHARNDDDDNKSRVLRNVHLLVVHLFVCLSPGMLRPRSGHHLGSPICFLPHEKLSTLHEICASSGY